MAWVTVGFLSWTLSSVAKIFTRSVGGEDQVHVAGFLRHESDVVCTDLIGDVRTSNASFSAISL